MIGEGLMGWLQGEDPRLKLLRAMSATPQQGAAPGTGTPATPPQGQDTSAGPMSGTGPVGPASPAGQPATPPQPQALQSPPDLVSLYSQITERDRRANQIDKGVMLMASAFARPENRTMLAQNALGSSPGGGSSGAGGSGSGGAGGPLEFIQNAMKLQQERQAIEQRAARRAALPQIAQRYGITLQTAQQLFDTGKLDDLLTNREQTRRTTMTDAAGQIRTIDQNTGLGIGEAVGPVKPDGTQELSRQDGSKALINSRTGEVIRELGAANPAANRQVVPGSPGNAPSIVDLGVQPGQSPVVTPIGNAPPRATQMVDGPNGSKIMVFSDDGSPVTPVPIVPQDPNAGRTVVPGANGGATLIDKNAPAGTNPQVATIAPNTEATPYLRELAQVNRDRAAAGQAPLSAEEFIKQRDAGTAPRTTITNNMDKAVDTGFAATYIEDFKKAQDATTTMRTLSDARRTLQSAGGIVSGSALSPATLEGRRIIGSIFGITDDATVNNTGAFNAAVSNVVRSAVKDLGSGNGITDSDRKFIQEAVGGDLRLNRETIDRILQLQEKASRNRIVEYNAAIEELRRTSPNTNARSVPVPSFSAEYMAAINPGAVELLKQRIAQGGQAAETARRDFDQVYGLGISQEILGQMGGGTARAQ